MVRLVDEMICPRFVCVFACPLGSPFAGIDVDRSKRSRRTSRRNSSISNVILVRAGGDISNIVKLEFSKPV